VSGHEAAVARTVRVGIDERETELLLECIPVRDLDPVEIAKRCSNVTDIATAKRLNYAIVQERGQAIESCVYVIGADNSPVRKIGHSHRIDTRISNLKREKMPDILEPGSELKLRSVFWMTKGHASMLENMCLRVAREHGLIEEREWLRATTFQAAVLIATCAKELDLKIADSAMWMRNRRKTVAAANALRDADNENRALNNRDWRSTPSPRATSMITLPLPRIS